MKKFFVVLIGILLVFTMIPATAFGGTKNLCYVDLLNREVGDFVYARDSVTKFRGDGEKEVLVETFITLADHPEWDVSAGDVYSDHLVLFLKMNHDIITPVDAIIDEIIIDEEAGVYTYKLHEVVHPDGYKYPSAKFEDVEQASWYTPHINYVVEKGIMNGMSATMFGVEEATTRGMIVTILYRISGEQVTQQEIDAMQFTDVDPNYYYRDAIAWASSKGIVMGTTTTTFSPDNNITREQMVTMLFRYVKYLGHEADERKSLEGFADYKNVMPYAVDAMEWANATGIISGISEYIENITIKKIAPQGETTRAEAATFIHRLCDRYRINK